MPHTRRQLPNRSQPPRHLQLLPQLRHRLHIPQRQQRPHIAPVAQPIVDPVQRNLHLPPILQRHSLCAHLAAIGKRLQHRRPQRRLRRKDLLQPLPHHLFMAAFTPGRGQKISHRIRHHHRAPVRRKQQHAITQRIQHLVQIRLQRGISRLLRAHLLAQPVDRLRHPHHRIASHATRQQRRRASLPAFLPASVSRSSRALIASSGRSATFASTPAAQHRRQRRRQRKPQRRPQPWLIRILQKRRPHPNMHHQKRHSVPIQRLRDIQHPRLAKHLPHLVRQASALYNSRG